MQRKKYSVTRGLLPARLLATLHRRRSWKMQPAATVVVFVATQGPLFHQSVWLKIGRHLKIKRALRNAT